MGWDEDRLHAVALEAAECPDACSDDVISLVREARSLKANYLAAVAQADDWHQQYVAERERRVALRQMIVDSASACTTKGCGHCKWLGFNLGRYESQAALSGSGAVPDGGGRTDGPG
jgi:hypothetical protein